MAVEFVVVNGAAKKLDDARAAGAAHDSDAFGADAEARGLGAEEAEADLQS